MGNVCARVVEMIGVVGHISVVYDGCQPERTCQANGRQCKCNATLLVVVCERISVESELGVQAGVAAWRLKT